MTFQSKCPCPGKENSYSREVSRDCQVSGHPPFSYCGHFLSFAGKEIFIFFLFSLYPSIIAMEIDSLQSDLAIFLRLHMQAVCYSIVFSEDRTAQRHNGELEQNGIGY
jgi:hypothetical protein